MSDRLVYLVNIHQGLEDRIGGIVSTIGRQPKLFSDPRELKEQPPPGCVIFDYLGMRTHDLSWSQWLPSPSAHIPFIVVSKRIDVSMAVYFMRKRIFTVLDATFRDTELISAIDDAIAQKRRLQHKEDRIREIQAIEARLNDRDILILDSSTLGMSVREIAIHHEVSQTTVSSIRKKLLEIFEVQNTHQLAAKYAQFQLVKSELSIATAWSDQQSMPH